MNPNLQTRVQRYGWDKASEFYDAGWKESLAPAQKQLLEMAEAHPGDKVLDLACGTGLVTFPITEAVGPTGYVLATDLAENMVEQVRSSAKQKAFFNIAAERLNAENLSTLADNTFDLVTCALGLMYCPNPKKALAEAFRVLKPGGRAVFAVWGARKSCGWAEIFPIVDCRVKSDVCPLFFRLGTGDVLVNEMNEVGFLGCSSVRIQTELPYKSSEDALRAAFLGGPVAMAYSKFDSDTRRTAEKEYLESIASFKSNEGYRIPGEFVVACATKQGFSQ